MGINKRQEITELGGLEIISFNGEILEEFKAIDPDDKKALKKFYNRFFEENFLKVDDLSQPYLIKTSTSKKKALKKAGPESFVNSLEPEFVPEGDRYELIETLQDLLHELGVPVFKSDFDAEMIDIAKQVREEQKHIAAQVKEKLREGLRKQIIKKADEEKNIVDAEIIETDSSDETDKK